MNKCEQRISCCVFHVWKDKLKSPDPIVQTFSRIHVWKQLNEIIQVEVQFPCEPSPIHMKVSKLTKNLDPLLASGKVSNLCLCLKARVKAAKDLWCNRFFKKIFGDQFMQEFHVSTFFKPYISRQSYGRSSICEALHNCFWSYNIYDMIHWGSYHIPEERVEYDGNYGDTEAGVPKDNVLKEFFHRR